MASRDIRRKFGQNYLSDPAIIFEMSRAISPLNGDSFLEIGPWHGCANKCS
jgi:16S rRNA A1518/A1519 N6-dimethyltransferase RsmA/KsgA/DIM1 with predicted DNA glycosylase/AP lyase activity